MQAKPSCPTTFEMLTNPGESGYADLAGVVAIWVLGCAVLERKAVVLGRLFAYQGDAQPSARWAPQAWELPLLCALHSFLVDATSYVQAQIALQWRRNVTQKLHDMYFSRMAFYRIHNDAKDPSISDPEVRICRDVREMVNGNAELAVALTEALVKTCFFGGLAIAYGRWLWALTAPMFFMMSLKAVLGVEPLQGSQVQITLQHVEGKFKRHLLRLQANAENVCMLQGEAFELDLMQKAVSDISHLAKQRCNVMFVMELAECMFFRTPQAATFLELAAHFSAACFGAGRPAAGAGRGGAGAPPAGGGGGEPCAWMGEHLGTQLRGVHSFLNACASWKAFVGARSQLLTCSYATSRVKQLFVRLDRLQGPAPTTPGRRRRRSKDSGQQQQQQLEHFCDGGPVVSFHGVTVQTPAKQTLARALTFSVTEGQPLLVCGHGGAGKSAIARCLCLLWPVGGGQIARPGGGLRAEEGAPLRGEVCYVPQRPYNALGSLSDQLTYPLMLPGGLPREELRRWLQLVDLEHLLDSPPRREGLLCTPLNLKDTGDDVVDWGACLSLGEQQAIGFARLLYHCPRFAILDECTSALDADFQERLYRMAKEAGITYITITRRPVLQEHHSGLLQLTGAPSEDAGGWSLSEFQPSGGHLARQRCRSAAEVRERLEEFAARGPASAAAAPSSPPARPRRTRLQSEAKMLADASAACSAKELVCKRWPSCASRMWTVLRISLQASHRRNAALRRLALILVALQARTSSFWLFCRSLSGMARASAVGDLSLVVAEFLTNCLVVCLGGLADQLLRHQAGHLSIELWAGAMSHLQRRLLKHLALCRVLCPSPGPSPSGRAIARRARPAVDDPVLGLLEVRSLFDAFGSQLCEALVPLATLGFLLPAAVRGMGAAAPALILTHWLLLRICHLLRPDLEALHGRTAALEGCFQALHSRLRASAEAVAASSGGPVERSLVEPRFKALLEHLAALRRTELLPRVWATFLFDYQQLPVCMHRFVSFCFAQKCGLSEESASAPEDAACVSFLFDRLMQAPQIAVQHLVRSVEHAARADLQCRRYLELLLACELTSKAQVPSLTVSSFGRKIRVQGLDLAAERGEVLAQGLEFDVEVGTPLLVTGPSASGKSLLASALLGLWAAQPRPPLRSLMASPQRPYLPAGCRLLAQLAYPTVLRLPSRPPFQAHAAGLPAGVAQDALSEHFARLGGTVMSSAGDERDFVITFQAFDELLRALSRPQDRAIDGKQFDLEFFVQCTGDGLSNPGGAAAPPPPPPPHGDSMPRLGRARRSLSSVGLEHVLLREPDGWFARRAWEEVLSGSEQQQVCLARLLYHGPAFAVLDECTSMLAEGEERRLHEALLREWGITPIALTRRPFLPELYVRELRLRAPGRPDGWELRGADQTDGPDPVAEPTVAAVPCGGQKSP